MKYSNLIKKIYIVESLGEALYSCMSNKHTNSALSLIYKTLSDNETRMKHLIENVAKEYSIALPYYKVNIYLTFSKLFFKASPHFILKNMLVHILRKQMFSSFHDAYRERDTNLWDQLLAHEKLQYQLLNL